MATIQSYSYLTVTLNGRPYKFGSLTVPTGITIDGEVHEWTGTVAVETTRNIFEVAEDLGDFDFLLVASDFDVMLELVVDDDLSAAVAELPFTVPITGSGTANLYGVPFILARDDAYAGNYTVNFGAGTLDVIETARVRNLSTTQAAEVICMAFT